jgi:hypothetical protein
VDFAGLPGNSLASAQSDCWGEETILIVPCDKLWGPLEDLKEKACLLTDHYDEGSR